MSKNQFGLIGLAVMGQNLVLNAADKGFRVSVYNRTGSKTEDFMRGEAKEKTIDAVITSYSIHYTKLYDLNRDIDFFVCDVTQDEQRVVVEEYFDNLGLYMIRITSYNVCYTKLLRLEGTENRITVERQRFNDASKDYNTYIKKFPRVIYAKWFDFVEKPYFKAEEGSNKAPKVEF